MTKKKTTEWEFGIEVNKWLTERINEGAFPFENSTGETSLGNKGKSSKRPDVILWINRKENIPYCGWELKTPTTSIEDPELLENATEKALRLNAEYFIVWNMKSAAIWRTPAKNESLCIDHKIKEYDGLPIINIEELWDEEKQELLKDLAYSILEDITELKNTSHLTQRRLDASFFVDLLSNTANDLTPIHQSFLEEQTKSDKTFRKALFSWAVSQGIANYGDPEFYEITSRQIVYRLIGKLIFYLTLKRFRSDLPDLKLEDLSPKEISREIKIVFSKAREIDYQAIFEEQFIDSIELPEVSIKIILKLIQDLNRFDFHKIPQDVLGNIYERLIPKEERHNFGQYFTEERLVDLILSFCIESKEDTVLDPTCGTGTFLSRAYDRLKYLGEKKHVDLLSKIWGFDIAPFPAQIATINLYKKDISNISNFPKIICKDFFNTKPNEKHKFPAINDPKKFFNHELPNIKAIVGNFPFIRQEKIEKEIKGYKAKIDEALMEDWVNIYPELFNKKREIRIRGTADLYLFLFFHAARFLSGEGARIGIITGNSWMDAEYGFWLQKFLTKHFNIISILESRCEPWFEDVEYNTVIIIAELKNKSKPERQNFVKFVKIKKTLDTFIPWSIETNQKERWQGLSKYIHEIENVENSFFKNEELKEKSKGVNTYDSSNYRIRFIKQDEIETSLELDEKTDKWSDFLRAPEIYYKILKTCGNKIIPLRVVAEIEYGDKSGQNNFFHLDESKIKMHKIEKEFLFPLLKSTKKIKSISINKDAVKDTYAFVCFKSRNQLRKDGKNALAYINWGAKQTNDSGIKWPETPSLIKKGLNWYIYPGQDPTHIFWPKALDDKLFIPFSRQPLICSDRMYYVRPTKRINKLLLSAALNSSMSLLFMELSGRVNLGGGVLDMMVGDVHKNMVIPDLFACEAKVKLIINHKFKKLSSRAVLSVFDEVKRKDRQEFDAEILKALGLNPKKFLPEIYSGLCELVEERKSLASVRKIKRKIQTKKDLELIKQEVLDEIIPNGLKKFPGQFIAKNLMENCKLIDVPHGPLKLGHYFMGLQKLINADNEEIEVSSLEEAKFIAWSQEKNEYMVQVPKDLKSISDANDRYQKYLRKIKNELEATFFSRTHDYNLSERLSIQIFESFGISDWN